MREVSKHTPELAQLVVANGGVGALVEYASESEGNNRSGADQPADARPHVVAAAAPSLGGKPATGLQVDVGVGPLRPRMQRQAPGCCGLATAGCPR